MAVPIYHDQTFTGMLLFVIIAAVYSRELSLALKTLNHYVNPLPTGRPPTCEQYTLHRHIYCIDSGSGGDCAPLVQVREQDTTASKRVTF